MLLDNINFSEYELVEIRYDFDHKIEIRKGPKGDYELLLSWKKKGMRTTIYRERYFNSMEEVEAFIRDFEPIPQPLKSKMF